MKQVNNIKELISKIFNLSQHRLPKRKIKLANNIPLSDTDYQIVNDICDIFIAINNSVATELLTPPIGGVFWGKAKPGMGPFELFLRKNRDEINHLFLLYNCFRDFCALAYEYDEYTPVPDIWVRRYASLAQAVKRKWRVRIPARFGEIGWKIGKYPVNRWTCVNQERINVMTLAGITDYLESQNVARILEIGGGAGEMGYVFSQALPNCTWYNCDLLGCLIYSTIQLAINLPKKQHCIYIGNLDLPDNLNEKFLIRCPNEAASKQNSIIYIPHFLIEDFKHKLNIHFAYNTYSFGEMPKESVMRYAELLSDFLKDRGILFEQNGYFPERGGDNPEIILESMFSRVALPPEFDGRWIPNGPTRIWCNNPTGKNIASFAKHKTVNTIIQALMKCDDKIDIHYPNELLWPKVYTLFSSIQNVEDLYAWNHDSH